MIRRLQSALDRRIREQVTAELGRRSFSLDSFEKAHAADWNSVLTEELTFHLDSGNRVVVTGRELQFTEHPETPPSPGSEATASAAGEAEPTPVADSVPAPQPSPSPRAAGGSAEGCNESILRDGFAVYCNRKHGHRGDHHNVWSGWRWAPHPLYVSQ